MCKDDAKVGRMGQNEKQHRTHGNMIADRDTTPTGTDLRGSKHRSNPNVIASGTDTEIFSWPIRTINESEEPAAINVV
jgi:hypothetical protein